MFTPVLAIFGRNLHINIYTNASQEWIEAVLKQPQENGEK